MKTNVVVPAKPVRWGYLSLGFLFLGLGWIGTVVPVMPSTIFWILSLWAFKRSSPRMEQWLLDHPVFGPTLRDWSENGSIKRRTKIVAISLIWVTILASCLFVTKTWVQMLLIGVAFALTAYLWSRPTKEV